MDYGTGWGDPSNYGVSDGWGFVGPDRSRKQHFILRCKACGSEGSYIKYQLGKPHGCSDCWYVEQIMRQPHLWPRLAPMIGAFAFKAERSELEELERIYALNDPRPCSP